MNENESREARKKEENKRNLSKRNGLGKIYYWVIGILFLILLLLIFFIFSRSGGNINLNSDDNGSSSVSDIENVEDTETEDQTDKTEGSETIEEEPAEDNTDNEDESDNEENSEEDTDEGDQADDVEPGESTVIDDSAPHDSSHAIDYNDGSADRVAIKNQIMEATGLGSDLTEWWVGENGPGRVEATVTNPSQSEIYRVYLQYGDGNWHVTSYERLNSNPYN